MVGNPINAGSEFTCKWRPSYHFSGSQTKGLGIEFPTQRCINPDDGASYECWIRIKPKVEAYVSLCNTADEGQQFCHGAGVTVCRMPCSM